MLHTDRLADRAESHRVEAGRMSLHAVEGRSRRAHHRIVVQEGILDDHNLAAAVAVHSPETDRMIALAAGSWAVRKRSLEDIGYRDSTSCCSNHLFEECG